MTAPAPRIDLSRARWRKSRWSTPQGQNCVEVATNLHGLVAVRDSKDPDGPTLTMGSHEWTAFVRSVKCGNFNQQ
jgi:hypothetical protein